MTKAIDHAKHNYDVCIYLSKDKKFIDWVVTTAYYSAIYFTHHKLFPDRYSFKDRMNFYSTFDSYARDYFLHNSKVNDSLHGIRKKLVEEHLSEISIEFSQLKDFCWTARYKTYNINLDVNYIIELLDKIKKNCT